VSTNFTTVSAAAAACHMRGGLDDLSSPSDDSGILPAPMPVEWASVPARRASHVQHATAASEEQAKRRYHSAAKKSEHRTARHLRKAILAMAAGMIESGELFELRDPTAEIAHRVRVTESYVDCVLIANSHAQERARKAQIAALRGAFKETESIADECYSDTFEESLEGAEA
jgi:hypothetical protein